MMEYEKETCVVRLVGVGLWGIGRHYGVWSGLGNW